MNFEVVSHLFLWYVLIFISGFIFWITFHPLFSKLSDKGYAVSKPLFLIILSFVLWLLGFIFKLPITTTTIFVFLILLFGTCFFIKKKFKIPFPDVKKRDIIITELVFLLFLVICLWVTSIHPTIDNVTERIMDFKMLNTLTNTSVLPAPDVWFTPKSINYYYYGHFFFSIINKLTFTDAFMGYLFAMSFIYAICGSIIFSIARSIRKNIDFAFLAACFVLFFSNFSFIYNLIEKYFNSGIPDDKKTQFWIFCIDLIIFLAILFSLTFIKRKNIKIFLLISIPVLIVHLLLTRSLDTFVQFRDFLLDPAKANLWFPDVSRVIDSTINEFPYYSIVIGDLHPHYVDLVFLPTMLTLLFLDFKIMTPKKSLKFIEEKISPVFKLPTNKEKFREIKKFFSDKYFQKVFFLKILSLVVFSAGIVTNSWEAVCFGFFIAVKDFIFVYRSLDIVTKENKVNLKRLFYLSLFPILLDAFVYIGAFILQLPYLRSVQAPIKGIKLNLINNSQDFITYLRDHFDILSFFKFFETDANGNIKLLFGLDRLIIIGLLIYFIYLFTKFLQKKSLNKKLYIIEVISLIVIAIFSASIAGVIISYVQSNFDLSPFYEYFKVWFVFYLLSAIALFYLIKKSRKFRLSGGDVFVLTSLISGIILSIFTEFFYVADYFDRAGYQHHRANSVFKINYIGFVFFGIVSAWAIYKLFKSVKWQKFTPPTKTFYTLSPLLSFLRMFVVVIVLGIFLYVPYSLNQWVNYFPENIRFSLDSYAQTKVKYPDVIEAVEFFKGIKNENDIILESNGDGYKFQDIASVYTTTPTVLGWWGHEAQWRETTDPKIIDDMLAERVSDIAKVYNLQSGWQDVIKKYKITYVWVGDAEREKQNNDVTTIFEGQICFERVFENTTVKIYKINQECANGFNGFSSKTK